MRVLVTGGAGFIGSHTVDKLVELGATVLIVDDLSTGREENINPKADFVKIDVASKLLRQEFERFKPDYVIHLAAQVSVRKSLENPLKDCETNIFGFVNVLDNCYNFNVKKVVYASSAAVYGNSINITVSEDSKIEPLSCYGISKLTPENYLKVYNRLYGLKYAVLRYANVYGPRQVSGSEGGVISIFIKKVLNGERPAIYGDGEQTRDFIYVDDVAKANVKALSIENSLTCNVGTGERTSINCLLSMICNATGEDITPIFLEAREGDIKHNCMDIRTAAKYLNWEPAYKLEEGIPNTVEYYRL